MVKTGTPKTGPKILLWDIETSPLVVATWGLFEQNIPIDNIFHDWFIICASWRWYGDDKTYAVSLVDDPVRFKKDFRDDRLVVEVLFNLIHEADIVVAQNGDNFDMKKLAARSLFHSLPPIRKIPSVDTLKEARRSFKMTSNKLDYLGQHLGLGAKMDNPRGLWIKAMAGRRSAIKQMVLYCRQDVDLLYALYERLLPHMKNHPNMNLIQRTDYCCPSCGSPHVIRKGTRISKTGVKQEWQCQECGSYSTGSSTLEKSELRS